MPTPIIWNTFAAGEVDPRLWGRTDLQRYRAGVSLLRNFFVDYRGPAVSRGGTQYCGMGQDAALAPRPRLIPFAFNDEQTYVLEFSTDPSGQERMRVLDRTAYTTDDAVTITGVTTGATTTITAPGHGLTTDDDIYVVDVVGCLRPNGLSGLNGRQLRVQAVAGDDITVNDELDEPIDSSGWTAYDSGGDVLPILSYDLPWDADDFFSLKYEQQGDTITFTNDGYRSYNITRQNDGSWLVEAEVFGTTIEPLSDLSISGVIENPGSVVLGGLNHRYRYLVTAFDVNSGAESPTRYTHIDWPLQSQGPQYLSTITLTWPAVVGGEGTDIIYRVYKAPPVPSAAPGTNPGVYGLIGEPRGTSFTDINYEPDFTRTPPRSFNPFSEGAITSASISDGGFGFISPTATVEDSTGSSGEGAVILLGARNSGPGISTDADPFGEITTIVLSQGGQNYSTPSVSITDDVTDLGSGAVLTFSGSWTDLGGGNYAPTTGSITIDDEGLNYHAFSSAGIVATATTDGTASIVIEPVITDGRITGLIYPTDEAMTTNSASTIDFTITDIGPSTTSAITLVVGSANNPACLAYFQQRKVYAGGAAPRGVFATRPNQFNNFDTSYPVQDDDGISLYIVGRDVTGITNVVAMSNGLLVFTSGGVYLLSGGASRNAITPTNVTAIPQIAEGSAQNPAPVVVDNDVVYVSSRGSSVQALRYEFQREGLDSRVVSKFSQHLLRGASIVDWAYAEEPWHVIWAVRDDGVMLSFTFLAEEEVAAWAHHDTVGKYISVCQTPECGDNFVYAVVERPMGNGERFYVTERFASRDVNGNFAGNVPPTADNAWCVDCGLAYPPLFPQETLEVTGVTAIRQIASVAVLNGGSDYSEDAEAVITDPTGSGATLSLTIVDGEITAVTVDTGGSGYTDPTITITDSTGAGGSLLANVTSPFVLASDAFTAADIGSCIRFGGGAGTILTASTGSATATMTELPHSFVPNDPRNPQRYTQETFAIGEWTLTPVVSIVGGLDHLRGMYVTGIADGEAISPRLVDDDGAITLDAPAANVTVGLGFTCQLRTLRLDTGSSGDVTVQGRRKNIDAVTLRTFASRGLQIGRSFETLVDLTEAEEVAPAARDAPLANAGGGYTIAASYANGPTAVTPLAYADHRVVTEGGWEEEGIVCVQQTLPYPAEILDVIPSTELGDDADG